MEDLGILRPYALGRIHLQAPLCDFTGVHLKLHSILTDERDCPVHVILISGPVAEGEEAQFELTLVAARWDACDLGVGSVKIYFRNGGATVIAVEEDDSGDIARQALSSPQSSCDGFCGECMVHQKIYRPGASPIEHQIIDLGCLFLMILDNGNYTFEG